MTEIVDVKIERMYDDVVIPAYKHDDDSGMDIRAYFSDEWVKKTYEEKANLEYSRFYNLHPHERTIIPTGIKVAIPNGYEIQVRPRSGMSIVEGITVLNTPGTVDAGYRGEIGIIVYNANPVGQWHKNTIKTIKHGDRIAQIVLQKVPKINWVEVESVDETTRGEGGFGHTGVS
jgi:dUTP pyrophosphatase